jgi:hypothetical protein
MQRVRISNDEKAEVVTICDHLSRLGFSKSLPYAVTEHGALTREHAEQPV